MIETNKERAVAAKNVQNPKIEEWLKSQDDAFLISLGRPSSGVDYDLRITDEDIHKNFNQQQEWFKSGKPLGLWEEGPFHLGNKIVMATWICGKAGIEGITFLDVAAEELVESKYEKRSFQSVMKRLIEEFDVGVRYTANNSALFHGLGAKEFDIQSSQDLNARSVQLPKTENLFDNRHITAEMEDQEIINIFPQELGGARAVMKSSGMAFMFTERPSERMANMSSGRVVLTDPALSEEVVRAVRLFGNHHEIYLLSGEVKLEISGLLRKFDCERLTVGSTAFLAFAIGHDFQYIKTNGVMGQADKEEQRLLQAVSQNENIKHV